MENDDSRIHQLAPARMADHPQFDGMQFLILRERKQNHAGFFARFEAARSAKTAQCSRLLNVRIKNSKEFCAKSEDF
jgi:hypothetical protein